MKYLLSVAATILCVVIGSTACANVPAQAEYTPAFREWNSSTIAETSHRALLGDSNAALELHSYYSMLPNEAEKTLYWAVIAAENGSAVGQYNSGFLLMQKGDSLSKSRAIFWFRRASAQGDTLASKRLRELGASD
jgi:TPR repeat protein